MECNECKKSLYYSGGCLGEWVHSDGNRECSEVKIYSLQKAREMKEANESSQMYQDLINRMDKQELLAEMVKYQQDRVDFGLTAYGIMRGKILFKALKSVAETPELYDLSNSYLKHLEEESKS
jgi:hypothetical protein